MTHTMAHTRLPTRAISRPLRLAGLLCGLLPGLLLTCSQAIAADPASIYYSAAPWDGAAYAIEIPQPASEGAQPVIRVNLWGNPEFAGPKTITFTGREDAGGGPGKGEGRASFQAVLNKSLPQNLAGAISFKALRKDAPVAGSYEFATLDGKRKFSGSFEAAWGNQPQRVIR